MLAKNLVREIVKRGGTAEITDREGRHSRCTGCGTGLTFHHVICAYEGGEDYNTWLADTDNGTDCPGTPSAKHEPVIDYELSGTLGSYDVHMYLSNSGDPQTGGSNYFTVRSISKRGTYDIGSDYNPGQWTFCNRLKDLDWACR